MLFLLEIIVFDNLVGANSNDFAIRLRSGANNDTNSTYYYANLGFTAGGSASNLAANTDDKFLIDGLSQSPHCTGITLTVFNPETEEYEDEVHYIGTLYVPDLVFSSGKKLEGRLEGRIVVYSGGQISPDFYSVSKKSNEDTYDVFEFCNGLEYELDSFMDYVVSELDDKNKGL